MRWLRAALVGLVLAASSGGCSGTGDEAPARTAAATPGASAPKVRLATARVSSASELSFQTYLEAEREAQLVAETDGEVVALRVREGQRVRVGDTLLVIDDRDERLALRRDEAEQAWSAAQLERTQTLQKQGHVSSSEVDQAGLQLQRAEAAVGLSRIALSRCAVRAPLAGLVWMIRAEPLHRVTVGQPLLRVTDPDRLRASAYLPANLRDRVRPGTRVRIVPASGGAAIEATVSRVDPLTDPASGTFKAVAAFRRRPTHPEAGSEARFVIPSAPADASLLVPITTLVESEGDSTWIWGLDGDRVRRYAVRLGTVRRDAIQIESGLSSGARVVVGSDRPLRDGAMVEVVDAQ